MARHTTKIHTLITLGVGDRARALVLKDRKRLPCGFDSHRPLHFRGLACPCAVLGRDLVYRPVPTVSTQPSTVPLIECPDRASVQFLLDSLIRQSSTSGRP